MSKFLVWLKDTAERAGRAFVTALVPSIVISQAADWHYWQGVVLAAAAPALDIVLSAIAKQFGNQAASSFQKDLPLEQVTADPKGA